MLHIVDYFKAFRGRGKPAPKGIHWKEIVLSWLGGFLGILVLAVINYEGMVYRGAGVDLASLSRPHAELSFLVGAFGASAALLFGAPQLPISQPYNCVLAHTIAAFWGVVFYYAFKDTGYHRWIGCGLAVGLSTGTQLLLRAYHPPSGSTAALGSMGPPAVVALSWFWIFMPCFLGAMTISAVAILYNNLWKSPRSPYPIYWIPIKPIHQTLIKSPAP